PSEARAGTHAAKFTCDARWLTSFDKREPVGMDPGSLAMLACPGRHQNETASISDTIAGLHQHRHDAPVHGRANLAIAAARSRRFGRRQRAIANHMRHAPMHKMEAVAIAVEFDAFHHAVDTEADGLVVELLDLETMLASIGIHEVAALAFTADLHLTRRATDVDPHRHGKGRGKRPAATPFPRMRMTDVKQQRRQSRVDGAHLRQ